MKLFFYFRQIADEYNKGKTKRYFHSLMETLSKNIIYLMFQNKMNFCVIKLTI